MTRSGASHDVVPPEVPDRAQADDAANAAGLHRNLRSTGIAIMALPAVSLVTSPLLSRALGATGRGEYASVSAPLLLAMTLATGGILEAAVYFLSRRQAPVRVVLRRSVAALAILSVLAAGVLCLLAGVLSAGSATARTLILYSSLSIPAYSAVVIARAFAAARREWRLVNIERYASALLRFACFTGLFVAGHLSVGLAVLVVASSTFLPGLVYARRGCFSYPRSIGGDGGPESVFPRREYLHIASLNWLAGVSTVILSRFDQAALAPLAGAAQLGLYTVAASIAEVPQLLTWAAREVLLSHDAHLEDTDGVVRATRVVSTATALLALAIGACAPWGIPLVFGGDFSGAVLVTEALLLAVIIAAPGNVLSATLTARGRARQRTTAVMGAVVVDVVLLFVLGPRWGGMGAALAMVVSALASTTLTVIPFTAMTGVPWQRVLIPRPADLGDLLSAVSRLRRGRP